ncbi:MAG: phosphoribosylaminoimidazolesuccinocarboxamide synthase [Clostridia bacterium]|nr:phosphoribosylaminoimidazolesuccinocarboxamide synthase [Clostridia bacterium]
MKKISSGKVRDIYEVDENSLMIVVSDRISALDFIMPEDIPDKGKILNGISAFWFDYVKDIVPNHIISTDYNEFPEEFRTEEFKGRSMWVKKLKMLPVECIVRGYITGSGWADYQKTGTICGMALPEGLQESQKLPEPMFTPSTKAEYGDHDENISFERCCEILGTELATKVKDATIGVYKKCADYALEKGIIIADTKFEFGLDENGELVLGDEVLTPDSSRFWALDKYEVGRGQDSFDKQYLRDWLKANGYTDHAPEVLPEDVVTTTRNKYLEAYRTITGTELA